MERAWARAADGGGPQAGLGLQVVQIFGDRQRLPDRQAAMQQHRHAARRRVLADRRLRLGQVERHHDLLEVDAGDPGHQPAAQRPRRVVLVADHQREVGHSPSPVTSLASRHFGRQSCLLHYSLVSMSMSLPFVDRSSSSLPVQFVSAAEMAGLAQGAKRGAARLDRIAGHRRQRGRSRGAARTRRQGRRRGAGAAGQADPVGFRRARHQAAGRHLEARRHRTGVADRCRRRDRPRRLALRALSRQEGEARRRRSCGRRAPTRRARRR